MHAVRRSGRSLPEPRRGYRPVTPDRHPGRPVPSYPGIAPAGDCLPCQGKLAPDFAGLQLGLAEKLTAQAVAESTRSSPAQVTASLRRTGDLGSAAEQLFARRDGRAPSTLDVHEVFQQLKAVAIASGPGAQRQKLSGVVGLLRRATPAEALVRTVTGKLRLRIGDATILDALAEVYGEGRRHRPALERAYNICSDLGLVAAAVARGGLVALARMGVRPGHPVRPMLAQRLSSPEAILKRLGGACAAEYEYDGERVQIHRQGNEITLFSRRLTRITDQYPDAVPLVRSGVRPRTAILKPRSWPWFPRAASCAPSRNSCTGGGANGVAEAMQRYPVGLFVFDLLSARGKDLTTHPYPERRRALAHAIAPSSRFALATERPISAPPHDLQGFFEEAITDGCEGVMCKSVAAAAVYQAGARGWLWIKYKREYQTRLQDTLDLVVVGASHGRGKRRGRYGALLLAAYDTRAERFRRPRFAQERRVRTGDYAAGRLASASRNSCSMMRFAVRLSAAASWTDSGSHGPLALTGLSLFEAQIRDPVQCRKPPADDDHDLRDYARLARPLTGAFAQAPATV